MRRDAAARVLRHPLQAAHEEIEHLADLAERGESAATPAVLIGGIALVLTSLAAVLIAVAFGAGYLATRGGGELPRASVETFWTIVTFAFVIGVLALPFVLLALLWRAAGRPRAG